MAEHLTTEQGRQGERRPTAMRALVIGTGLTLAAMAALLLWTYADSLTSYPAQSPGAATGSPGGTGGGASSAQSGNVPGGNPSYPAPSVKNANQ